MAEEKVKKKVNHKDKEVEELNNKVSELDDKYKRLSAEFINYRVRTEGEIANMFKYEGTNIILNIIEIADDFERAIKSDDDTDLSDEVALYLKGMKMIYSKLIGTLEKYEVKEINCEGLEFNPEVAEAVLTDHDEDKPENVVLEVLRKGYTYKDKVIRTAFVKVNK